MKIRRVKPDPNDVTLAIPSSILPGLNADFDGDVLNTMAIPLDEIAEYFDNFSPLAMSINRTTSSIKSNCSALENIILAIISDI